MWPEQRDVRDLKIEGATREAHEPGGSCGSEDTGHGRSAGRSKVGTARDGKERNKATIGVGPREQARAVEDGQNQLRR